MDLLHGRMNPLQCHLNPLQSRPSPKHRFEGHKETIQEFVFLHDKVHIVSGLLDGTMRKWNYDTGTQDFLSGNNGKGGGRKHICIDTFTGWQDDCVREGGRKRSAVEYRWRDVWTGHSQGVTVCSLSWSPSESDDETILIRKAESGEAEVGPIETKLRALVYSPSGERIACIARPVNFLSALPNTWGKL